MYNAIAPTWPQSSEAAIWGNLVHFVLLASCASGNPSMEESGLQPLKTMKTASVLLIFEENEFIPSRGGVLLESPTT
jgi:hypothetical protein